tara:strand:- start:2578 stop:2802 length:225 start_codon:yes stop_codon:yes gene_type:complete
MSYISGWFESDEGAVIFDYEDLPDHEELAYRLYLDFGIDCSGVDMEVEGEYLDGLDVSTTMTELFEDLDFLTCI